MSVFKSRDKDAYPIVNPPSAFSENEYLYKWTVELNEATQSNLCNGKMVYVKDKKQVYADMKEVLRRSGILFVLCDFHSDAKSIKEYVVFGKTMKIPIGALKFATENTENVFFAGFRWDFDGLYRLDIFKMQKSDGNYEDSYIKHLTAYVSRYPYTWQNWEHV